MLDEKAGEITIQLLIFIGISSKLVWNFEDNIGINSILTKFIKIIAHYWDNFYN